MISILLKNNVQLLYKMQEEFSINRIVPLMLKVADIQLFDIANQMFPYEKTVSNNVGTISKCVTNVTWNINLKELLGDLYNQYDYFNLEVPQIMTTPFTGGGYSSSKPFANHLNTDYQNLNVFISGLNWVRSSFNQKTGAENSTVHLCNVQNNLKAVDNNNPSRDIFGGDTYIYLGQTGYMNYNLCFKKEANVNINIRLGGLGSGLDYTPSDMIVDVGKIMQHFIIKLNIIPFK
jgi:hypothetical protein